MTILRGHFTMTLVVSVSPATDSDSLRSDLEAVADKLDLEAISLSEVTETDPADDPIPSHIVSVYGADHPGIVNAVSTALSERGVSITDLTTRLAGEQTGEPLYAMMLEIALPADVDPGELENVLGSVGSGQSVDVTIRQLEQDTL